MSALSSLGAASPATLYVAPEGADGPNCGLTRETACASFDRAYHAAAPGDEVEIAGGNYPPQLFSPDPTKTSEDDVVFRPAPGARVELRCANFANCLATEGADHLTVSGIETAMIADLGGKPRQAGVAVDTGSADVTFEDIDAGLLFIDSDATRVNILGGDYGPVVDTNSKIQNGVGPDILIDGARFHDHVKVTENQHVECLALYGADGVTIRNSRFDTCQDFGIFGSPDAGEHYRDVTLENNFFSNSGKVSMSAHFKIGSHGGDCSNFLVRNNTFYDENVIAECGIEGGTATNMRWIGNLIADPGDDQRAGDPCSPGPHVFDHNVIEVGPTCGPNDRVVDNAGFVDIYTGNLHLLPTSPAIDAGSVAESPATDIDGEQREPGAPDAGADEYTGERDPVTASIGDVTVRENVAGGKAVFDVTLSRQAPRQIEIDWEAKPGTAGLGDFTAGTGTLVIPPAGRSGTIEVPIVNDSLTEPLEKFTVELSNPRGAALADGVGEGSIDDDDGTVPQIDIADAEAAEGSGVQFKVSLTSPLARSVTVKFTTSPGTARQEPAPGQPQDYLGQTNATLVIPANTIQITRTVNTASDDLVEPDETFTARLSAPTEAVIGDGTATGTIRDEDRAITVGDAQVTEGADVAFPITLSEPAAAGGVKLRLRTTDGSAKSGQGQDFTARDEVITIPAGQSQATFAVATLADALDESFETFSLLASAPQGAKIADGSATGTIVDDDDPPALTVGAAQAAEGEALTFPVALSAPSGREVRATLSTRDGSAQAPGDYAARTEEIVIAAGATGASFTVPGAADGVDEQDETFDAVIGAPVNATVADPDATGTIVDDDTTALSVGDAQVGEGGTLSFPVTLSTPSSRAVSALLQTSNGSATSPGDYAPRSDTVILPAGETQVAFTVETATDQLDEPDETLAASASNVTDAAAGTLSGTGTIADDDDPPAVSVGAAQAGEGGVLSFPVTLSAPSGRTVKAVLSTRDGSASAPGDYTARADVAIELGPGETAAAFTVQSAQDQVDEDDEQLTATIVGREHAQAGVLSAGGTIGDDDTTSVGFAADPSVEEGATAVATVRLSMPSTRPVRVEVSTEDGTATQPADYTRVQGHEVTIAAGSTEATVSVPTATDTTDEPDETFRLGLSAAQGAQLGDDSATVTIRDDDPRKVSVGDATASEGERLTFPVRLTTASDEPVTLTLTTADDTAHASDDYTARSGQVTLPAGATEASFTVDTAEDTIDEPDETLHVVISNVQGDAVPATATPANGTIADDDARPHASIEAAEATEGAKLRFRVRLSHPSSRPVGLSLSTADGTAAAPGDYAARTGATLDVAPGQTEAFFEFDTVADESVEGDETLTARIESATNADVGAAAQAVGTIRDDDRSLTVAAAEATEGDGVEFDVSLSGPAVKTVNLRLRTVAGPAVAGQDFITTDEQLTIAAGQSGTTFTVPTLEDQLDEDAEGFTVQLSELQGASLDGDGEAAGTILDDDDPPAVSLGAAQAGEGDELGFPVSLSAPSGRPVSVRLSTSDDGATAGSDYTPRSDVDVVFAPGDTAKAFTVASIEDEVDEPDERLGAAIVGRSGATAGTLSASGTIVDDDTAALSVGPAQIGEGGKLSFPVTLSTRSSRSVSALLSTADDSAREPGDYAARSATVTVPAGETQAAFTVDTAPDELDEPDESLAASASDVTNAAVGTATAAGTILDDDDAPAVSVGTAEADEGDVLTFPVTLSAPSGRRVTARLSTSDGTATAGSDYTARSDVEVAFAPGATTAEVNVQSAEDAVQEPDEQLVATIVARDHALAGRLSADGTIRNDDTARVSVDDDPSVNEGATATVPVRLSTPSTGPVSVKVSTEDGTAAQPGDYTRLQTHEVTIPVGATEASLPVPTAPDPVDEPDESFRLVLSSPQGADLGDASATVTIVDDDEPPAVTVGAAQADEGGVVSFPVTLSAPSGRTITVRMSTGDGSATAPADYAARAHVELLFAPGDTAKAFTVQSAQDAVDEPDEQFKAEVLEHQHALAGALSAQGTIRDDDAPPPTGGGNGGGGGNPPGGGGTPPAGGTPPGGASPPPADAQSPDLSVQVAKRVDVDAALGGKLSYWAECSEACTLTATLSGPGGSTATASAARVLGRGKAKLDAAGRVKIRIKVPRKAVKALRRAAGKRLVLRTTATDAANNRRTVSRKLKLMR